MTVLRKGKVYMTVAPFKIKTSKQNKKNTDVKISAQKHQNGSEHSLRRRGVDYTTELYRWDYNSQPFSTDREPVADGDFPPVSA